MRTTCTTTTERLFRVCWWRTNMTKLDTNDMTLIGFVGVDSGQIMIGDPCYTLPYKQFSEDPSVKGRTYDTLLNAYDEDGSNRQLHLEPFGDGIVQVVSSGYGDGYYPVYAEI